MYELKLLCILFFTANHHYSQASQLPLAKNLSDWNLSPISTNPGPFIDKPITTKDQAMQTIEPSVTYALSVERQNRQQAHIAQLKETFLKKQKIKEQKCPNQRHIAKEEDDAWDNVLPEEAIDVRRQSQTCPNFTRYETSLAKITDITSALTTETTERLNHLAANFSAWWSKQ